MINKRYGLYLSDTINTSFYTSVTGQLYEINDINTDHLENPITWNNAGIGNFKGLSYGKDSYENYIGTDLTTPTTQIALGNTVTGGMQLWFYKGYVINKRTKKFMHGETTGVIALDGLLRGIYYYNDYWYITTENGIFKMSSLDSTEYETVISGFPYTISSYEFSIGAGNKIYIFGWGATVKYIEIGTSSWITEPAIPDVYFKNFNYFKNGALILSNNTLYFITETGITNVSNVSYIPFVYGQLIDDFVNEQIIVGTTNTGYVDIIKYNGQRVAQFQSPNRVAFMFPFYREYECNIIGEHISVTNNGVLDYMNDSESYCVNNEQDFVITITPEEHYRLTNITSEYGTVDLENGTITYNNRDSYTIDNVNITSELALVINAGSYKITAETVEQITGEVVECNAYTVKNNRYFHINSIEYDYGLYFNGYYEDDLSEDRFIVHATEVSSIISILEDFNCPSDIIYNILHLGTVTAYLSKDITFNVTRDDHSSYNVLDAVLMNNNKYFGYSYNTGHDVKIFSVLATFDDGYGLNTISSDKGEISGILVSLTGIEDNSTVNITITSKPLNDLTMKLYNFIGETENKLNKTLNLIDTVYGRIRNIQSVLTPTIILERNTIDFNYVEFSVSGRTRYYFVRDYQSTAHNTYVINLYEDTLMTWKSGFINQRALIERYSLSDRILSDNYLATKLIPRISRYEFNPVSAYSTVSRSYIISFLGKVNGEVGTNTILPTNNPTLNSVVYDEYIYNNELTPTILITDSKFEVDRFWNWVKQNTLESYVYGIYSVPFRISPKYINIESEEVDNTTSIVQGYIDVSTVTISSSTFKPSSTFKMYAPTSYKYLSLYSFDIPRSTTLNIHEKRLLVDNKYELFIPFVGNVILDSVKLALIDSPKIVVSCMFNCYTGSVRYNICETTTSQVLATGDSQMVQAIAYSTDNEIINNNKREALNNSLALNMVSSTLSFGIGAVSGKVNGIVGGLLGASKSFAGYLESINTLYPKASLSTVSDGFTGKFDNSKAVLNITEKVSNITDYDNYVDIVGQPFNDILRIGDIPSNAYIKIADIELVYYNKMTKEEHDTLLSKLTSGIII